MANTTNYTQKELFNALKAIVNATDLSQVQMPISANNAELIAFVDSRIDAINKKALKASAKRTDKAKDNAPLTDAIVATLSARENGCTVTEMMNGSDVLKASNSQKITYLLRGLVDDGTVTRNKEKGKSIYSIVR